MVAVVDKNGVPLMPTSEYKARRLMKKGRAEIFQYRPFTIRIVDREGGDTQPIEYCSDTGSVHVGISIKSEKHEYVDAQFDLQPDEKENHDAQRKHRRSRRNHKRYREPRFDNRKREEGWIAPSLQHKKERQQDIFRMYAKVMPITSATFEVGKFDTQELAAIEAGEKLPEGKEYQQGIQYQHETLRKAVFARDDYKCVVCGRGIEDHAILHIHHLGFKVHDHSDRAGNLATVCEKCHTPANHKKGGKLWDLDPEAKPMKDAAFMNTVRWMLVNELKAEFPEVEFHTTYGAMTSVIRKSRNIPKTHANDAYCIGNFFPKHRTKPALFKKVLRNDRRLQKFYDAVYIDTRDGEKKKGNALSCGRIKRNRNKSGENLRKYRGRKVSSGHVSIRRGRAPLSAGSKVLYNDEILTVKGTHRNKKGDVNVEFTSTASNGKKSTNLKNLTVLRTNLKTSWVQVS